MRKILDLNNPFFRPLWIRIATVAAIILWTGFEIWLGNTYWAAGFIALGLYVSYCFFIDFRPREPEVAAAEPVDDTEQP